MYKINAVYKIKDNIAENREYILGNNLLNDYKNNILNILIILMIGLGIFACKKSNNPLYQQELPIKAGVDSITILALGDSYTIGTSVSEDDRWPNQLRDSLEVYGIAVKKLQIIARNGWTTGDLLNAINNQNLEPDHDLVGLLIGVNNQFQGRTINEYAIQFQQLLELAVVLAGGEANRIFVLSIPDYSVTPRGSRIGTGTTALELDKFNAKNKQLSDQFSVNYLDITPISRAALDDLDLVASDDLHFSAKMYSLWVKYMLKDIMNMLNST